MKRNIVLIFSLLTVACHAAPGAYTPMFENYLAVQTSLAADDLQAAVSAAKKMESSVPQKGKDQNAGERLSKISLLTKNLAASTDLEQARAAFAGISVLMIPLKSESGIQMSEYFCPMVRKSWLQRNGKTQNPYFGKRMIGCGEKKS